MRIYVATKFEDKLVASGWIRRLRQHGIDITHDWPAVEELDSRYRRHYAEADAVGVATADLVWVLAPQDGGRGCWTEMGIALGKGIRVVVSGPGVGRNIFDELTTTFKQHDDAFNYILLLKHNEKTGFTALFGGRNV